MGVAGSVFSVIEQLPSKRKQCFVVVGAKIVLMGANSGVPQDCIHDPLLCFSYTAGEFSIRHIAITEKDFKRSFNAKHF